MKLKLSSRFTGSAALVAACLTIGTGVANVTSANAQDALAPPVQDTYNWHDVPVGQQIQITKAVFDQGGYRLYASTGEMIVVPFDNQNLYVMKFGRTGSGPYFVNDGSTPTFYIPAGYYLENDGAQGARWYPFPQNYAYTAPVYVGFAPSWSAWTSMGWYPGMTYYGGYYGYHPWHAGLSFSPLPGLVINIGGHPYYGWGGYHDYYYAHPYGRVYVNNFRSYSYRSIPRRPTSVFVSNHNYFVHNHTTVRNTTIVHNSFGHNTVMHNGGSFHGGSFGRATPAHVPFGGTHTSGSFGHASSAAHVPFGGGARSTGGSFGSGHTGAFGGGRPAGAFGGDHGAAGGHAGGAFGGGTHGGATHGGSFGGGTHTGSFGGGRSDGHSGGGGGDHHH